MKPCRWKQKFTLYNNKFQHNLENRQELEILLFESMIIFGAYDPHSKLFMQG
jgi:hypothetical protein